jgi:hypothetical protein
MTYDDFLAYEEDSFYWNDKTSDSTLGLAWLFSLPIRLLIHLVFFLIRRFDVTNGLLVSGIFQLLILDKEWDPKLRLLLFIGMVVLSVVIQRVSKIASLLFALFSCTCVAVLGGIWKHYDSQITQYVIMGICFAATALLNFASWIQRS